MSIIPYLQQLKSDPEINVISEEVFHKRVCDVFSRVSDILQKSLGPCGAPAVISTMPHYHVTKDGFTIAKNLMFENTVGYVDQVITYMIMDICERLNYMVGDGTTSAIVCTNKIYQEFQNHQDEIDKLFFLPRDILYRLNTLKKRIENSLNNEAIDIKTLSKDEMLVAILRTVYISSNGNVDLTMLIVDMYKKLEFPAIQVAESKDGITRGIFIDGFPFPAQLTDKLYINNDNNTCELNDVDVIIFDHKVGNNSFYLISKLREEVKRRGRSLLVLAPSFDTVALSSIAPELNVEYVATKKISTILAVYPNSKEIEKKRVGDLAMLLNTQIITIQMEQNLIVKMKKQNVNTESPVTYQSSFNLDCREIPEILVAKYELANPNAPGAKVAPDDITKKDVFTEWTKEEFSNYPMMNGVTAESIRVGFTKKLTIGMESATFSGFYYNENLYSAYLNNAHTEYIEVIDKYKRSGAFTFEIDDAQYRYNALKLKTGIIEVGANTSFSLEFEKDVVDDAVKAAQSVYFNGYVIGGHVSLIRAIDNVLRETVSKEDRFLLSILKEGFSRVNGAILENAFEDFELESYPETFDNTGMIDLKDKNVAILFDDKKAFKKTWDSIKNSGKTPTIYRLILGYECRKKVCLDLGFVNSGDKFVITFNNSIINSAATDKEILTAAIDLTGLLITGNQLIVSRPVGRD